MAYTELLEIERKTIPKLPGVTVRFPGFSLYTNSQKIVDTVALVQKVTSTMHKAKIPQSLIDQFLAEIENNCVFFHWYIVSQWINLVDTCYSHHEPRLPDITVRFSRYSLYTGSDGMIGDGEALRQKVLKTMHKAKTPQLLIDQFLADIKSTRSPYREWWTISEWVNLIDNGP